MKDDDYETSTTATTSSSTQVPETQSSEMPTTTMKPFEYLELSRSEWMASNSINFDSKYKLNATEKIILTTTQTDDCNGINDCIDFIIDYQQSSYPQYDDIRENFIIAIDGTILEGRGFYRETETTCEANEITCYNSRAISISFIQTSNGENEITEYQREAFCLFLRNKTEEEKISKNFTIFQHDMLTTYNDDDVGIFDVLKECDYEHRNSWFKNCELISLVSSSNLNY
jgi:hypothetical protein